MIFPRIAAVLAAVAPAAAAPYGQSYWGPSGGIAWGRDTVRGVNLGGWLVAEPWIVPSIFEQFPLSMGIVDEYTLGQKLGQEAAQNVLRAHWDSFYSLGDFQKIAASGFNVVRIPIGFWAIKTFDTPYATGAAPYLDRAIDWARQTGLKVIIDLHGAPRSQNGFDNSGQKMDTPQWLTGDSAQQTHEVLRILQWKYGVSQYDDVVAAIEVLNEPLTPRLDLNAVKQFERDAYNDQRIFSQSRVVMIQDGFQPPSSYNGWLTPSDNNAQWVVLDHHEYQVFTNEQVAMVPWQHRQAVCNGASSWSGADKWTIVGEWSGAMTDCATYLNGYGVGARYDGSYPGSSYVGSCNGINDINSWSQSFRDDMRGYIEAQMEVFEHKANGWVFWTWKTERSPEWDAAKLIDAGIFPQPLSDRKFGQICTN